MNLRWTFRYTFPPTDDWYDDWHNDWHNDWYDDWYDIYLFLYREVDASIDRGDSTGFAFTRPLCSPRSLVDPTWSNPRQIHVRHGPRLKISAFLQNSTTLYRSRRRLPHVEPFSPISLFSVYSVKPSCLVRFWSSFGRERDIYIK